MLHHARTLEHAFTLTTLCLCALGCKLETKVIPATQIVADIGGDATVRRQTQSLEVTVSSASRRNQLELRKRVFERTIAHFNRATESSPWPVRLVLAPEAGDPRRVFELRVIARDERDEILAEARAITGFVEHEVRYVSLRLTQDCLRVRCGEAETCNAGVCDDAWLAPSRLPLLPGPRIPDEDVDAAVAEPADAGAHDAAPPSTPDAAESDASAATDAGAVVDAGPRIDRCLIGNGGCDARVTCLDTDLGVLCGACPNGFLDVTGAGTRCEDVDECARDNGGCDAQHGRCKNTAGGFECSCAEGWHGNGRSCTANIPCGDSPELCDALATCVERSGARVCVCNTGYEGNGAVCRDTDECAAAPNPCGPRSTCANTSGSFTCTCDPGFALRDGRCADFDECAAGMDTCDDEPNACVNDRGTFHCACPGGWSGDGVGPEGCRDINECRDNTDGCGRDALCENHQGSFSCLCDPGYAGDGKGEDGCRDLDECSDGSHDCSPNATCENTPGSYSCRCNEGFSGNGRDCERPAQ